MRWSGRNECLPEDSSQVLHISPIVTDDSYPPTPPSLTSLSSSACSCHPPAPHPSQSLHSPSSLSAAVTAGRSLPCMIISSLQHPPLLYVSLFSLVGCGRWGDRLTAFPASLLSGGHDNDNRRAEQRNGGVGVREAQCLPQCLPMTTLK